MNYYSFDYLLLDYDYYVKLCKASAIPYTLLVVTQIRVLASGLIMLY